MKCPECIKEGLKSSVCPGGSSTTLLCCPPFYDEDGKYHDHDRNWTTYDFTCSNGHIWAESSQGSCWCGWPEKKERV